MADDVSDRLDILRANINAWAEDDEYLVTVEVADLARLLQRLDSVVAAGDAMADELARWGWGDMHYSHSSPQERSVVDALAAWRCVVPVEVGK